MYVCAEGLEVQSQPFLHNKLEASLEYMSPGQNKREGKKINDWKLALIQIYKKHTTVQRPLHQHKNGKIILYGRKTTETQTA